MPTVLREGPYRFFFYAGDRNEPPHVHVKRNDREAKFWLQPIRLAWSSGFSSNEINRIHRIIERVTLHSNGVRFGHAAPRLLESEENVICREAHVAFDHRL